MKYFLMIPFCLALVFSPKYLAADASDDYRSQCIENLCCSGFSPGDCVRDAQIYGSYSVGRSFGISDNYGAFGIFYAPCLCPCSCGPVVDLTYLTFDDGKYGFSADLGLRFNNSNDSIVGGIHGNYEYREADAGNFCQLGMKLEVIGDCFEIVANGYFPIDDKEYDKLDRIFDDYDNTGTDVPYQVNIFDRDYALTGFDLEAGYKYCCSGLTAYAGVGTYYFEREPYLDLWGVKGKLRVDYGQLISIEGQVTWDDHNNTDGRLGVGVHIPFDVLCNFCEAVCCPCNSQRRTSRDRPVHLEKCCKYVTNY